jgi:hypothetical protein
MPEEKMAANRSIKFNHNTNVGSSFIYWSLCALCLCEIIPIILSPQQSIAVVDIIISILPVKKLRQKF